MESRKTNWVHWNMVCGERDDIGLGLKNLTSLNIALLGKWIWRIHIE